MSQKLLDMHIEREELKLTPRQEKLLIHKYGKEWKEHINDDK